MWSNVVVHNDVAADSYCSSEHVVFPSACLVKETLIENSEYSDLLGAVALPLAQEQLHSLLLGGIPLLGGIGSTPEKSLSILVSTNSMYRRVNHISCEKRGACQPKKISMEKSKQGRCSYTENLRRVSKHRVPC
jgi:hypothetical protein